MGSRTGNCGRRGRRDPGGSCAAPPLGWNSAGVRRAGTGPAGIPVGCCLSDPVAAGASSSRIYGTP